MTAPRSAALYSPQLLSLAVELANYPFDASAPAIGEARSRSCGSTLAVSLDGETLGLRVAACAVGQASAAIFARHFARRSAKDVAATLAELEAWLEQDGELPDWPDLALLEPARAYPGRHGAILLPWKAALDALSKGGAGR